MLTLIEESSYLRMPWKNGGGETVEIFRESRSSDDYGWRLSQATVASGGPFSLFPGKQRCLCVISGPGLYLNDQLVATNQVIHFSGESVIDSKLVKGQKVEDLNIIYDPQQYTAQMMVIDHSIPIKTNRKGFWFFYGIKGTITLDDMQIQPGNTLMGAYGENVPALKFSSDTLVVFGEVCCL